MVSTAALPRHGTERQLGRPTLGDYLAEIADGLGFNFYPWQSLLSDVSLELIPRAGHSNDQSVLRLNHQYVGAMVGRQSGKTAWSVTRILAQALLPNRPDIAERICVPYFRSQEIVYTAQSRTVAVQKWQEHIEMIEASQYSRLIKKIALSTGRECLTFINGSQYRPITPNRTGARGLTLDLAIVDEALAHPLWLLQVIRPTMAQRDGASLCMGSQFVVISNAGDDDAELLNRMQELGIESLSNPAAKRCWFEWSMRPGSDPLDEATWLETMPTLEQPDGITLEFLRMEAESLHLDQFMREYLCVRVPKSDAQLIPSERWQEAHRDDVILGYDVVLALDIPMERQRATIMAAGQVGDYIALEVVDGREGLDWVLDRVAEVCQRWTCPVVIDSGGPAASLIASLQARNVTVIAIAAREVANAAAMLYDAVMAKRVAHRNDYRLNDAVTGASKRAIGERWAFDRRGHVDISPLVASSFALWAIETGQIGSASIY